MKRILASFGRLLFTAAAIAGMLALALFLLGVALVSIPYKKTSNGKIAAIMNMISAAGELFAAASYLKAEATPKQHEKQHEKSQHENADSIRPVGHNR